VRVAGFCVLTGCADGLVLVSNGHRAPSEAVTQPVPKGSLRKPVFFGCHMAVSSDPSPHRPPSYLPSHMAGIYTLDLS
jgi:hypothetical protein